MTNRRKPGAPTLLALCAALAAPAAFAQATICGPLKNGYGPYDYRNADAAVLGLVERPHFPPIVEALIRGNRGTLAGDLDYTLRAFPNHHRALVSVMRYGERMKSDKPGDLRYTVECYFDRALRFQPEDAVARMLYVQYLIKQNRSEDAAAQLALVANEAGEQAFTHFNVGLLYVELKQYDKALVHAHQAEALGFPRTELRDKLQAAGQWRDAPPPAPTAPTPEAAEAAKAQDPAR